MSFEHATSAGPQPPADGLPGRPEPFFLESGAGERSINFDALTTVLLSADETERQFGVFVLEQPEAPMIPTHSHAAVHEIFYVVEGGVTVYVADPDGGNQSRCRLGPGDFGYVPAGFIHTFETHDAYNKVLGVSTGGFERFFQEWGQRTDQRGVPATPYVPEPDRIMGAFRKYDNRPLFDFAWTV